MNRYQQTGKALGSDILLTILTKDKAAAKLVFTSLWAQIDSFEKRFSRFLVDSELSKLNLTAGKYTKVSPAFINILREVQKYTKETNGLYSPFVLPSLQRAGYVGSWPSPQTYNATLAYTDRNSTDTVIIIKSNSVLIPVNTAIDLGGIGKGYLLDQLADYLNTNQVKDYWLSLGGDIICEGFDIDKQAWKIGLANAKTPEENTNSLINADGARLAIATSGTTKRAGKDWHHIIDPRTLQPAKTDILAATVVSSNATAADIYAKCLVILGSKSASQFVDDHTITAALLQTWHNEHIEAITFGALK